MFVWCELGANMVASIARKQGFWVIELELEVQKVNHKYKWGYYKSTFEFVKEKYQQLFNIIVRYLRMQINWPLKTDGKI